MLASSLSTLTLALALASTAQGAAVHTQPRATPPAHLAARASSKCSPGFYSHSDQLGCYPCGANALTCQSTTRALTCKKGYTVQSGFCKAAVIKTTTKKKTTTTAKKTTTKKAAVVATSTKVAAIVTKTITVMGPTVTAVCSDDEDDDLNDQNIGNDESDPTCATTEYVTSTEYATKTLYSVSVSVSAAATVTKTATQTVTTTQAPVTTTLTVQGTASTPITRAGVLPYAGCFSTSTLSQYQLASTYLNSPSPFTASTAVAECLYALAAQTKLTGKSYTHCQIQGNLVYLYAMNKNVANSLPGKVDDSNCDQTCSISASVTNVYGLEYCGSNSGSFNSVYALPALA